jgi:Tol biopolymer transport system component
VAFFTHATNFTAVHAVSTDLVVKDRVTGTVTLANVSSAGVPANGFVWEPVISGDGRYVAFSSSSSNLVANDNGLYVDVFVHDVVSGTTVRASVDSFAQAGEDDSYEPALSFDGRLVAFTSYASNLVPGDTNGNGSDAVPSGVDVFLRDLQTGTTERMSLKSGGQQAASGSHAPSISADGRFVCFASRAPDLVANDSNAAEDLFVRDRVSGAVERVSVGPGGWQSNANSIVGEISADGNSVVFVSAASNLVPNDTNLHRDVYVHDRAGSPPPTSASIRVDCSSRKAATIQPSRVTAASSASTAPRTTCCSDPTGSGRTCSSPTAARSFRTRTARPS